MFPSQDAYALGFFMYCFYYTIRYSSQFSELLFELSLAY